MVYELKCADGKTVVWHGESGADAARRYVDVYREDTVTAWRSYPRHGLFVGVNRIEEPQRG